jgi:hypothetical protein
MIRGALVPQRTVQSENLVRLLGPLLAMTAVAAMSGLPSNAHALGRSGPPSSAVRSAPSGNATLPEVTVEATEAGRKLKRRVDQFVTSLVVEPGHDSVARWNTPICLMVEGFPFDANKTLLARVLQAATAAHAPLAAGEDCTGNLYIIASNYPDQLLQDLLAHNPTMFRTRSGQSAVERYLHSRRPVRAWYNTGDNCSNDPRNESPAAAALIGSPLESYMSNTSGLSFCSGGGSRVFHEGLPTIRSAIIIVDKSRMEKISAGQLAAYVSMVALADIRLDADTGRMPTILRLFQHAQTPPQDLSRWDRALLYALYNTSQSGTIQVSEVKSAMMQQLSTTIAAK